MRRKVFIQWVQIILGLLVFAFGVHLTIFANIGLAPWDCLGMGIAKHTPLNYGLSMTLMSLVILCIDLLLKKRRCFGEDRVPGHHAVELYIEMVVGRVYAYLYAVRHRSLGGQRHVATELSICALRLAQRVWRSDGRKTRLCAEVQRFLKPVAHEIDKSVHMCTHADHAGVSKELLQIFRRMAAESGELHSVIACLL